MECVFRISRTELGFEPVRWKVLVKVFVPGMFAYGAGRSETYRSLRSGHLLLEFEAYTRCLSDRIRVPIERVR